MSVLNCLLNALMHVYPWCHLITAILHLVQQHSNVANRSRSLLNFFSSPRNTGQIIDVALLQFEINKQGTTNVGK